MEQELTKRQGEILSFLKRFLKKRGYPPTIREICTRFGFQSPRGAKKHLDALEKKGVIRRSPGSSRAIEIAGMKVPETVSVPILGSIPAGPLNLAVEEVEGEMAIDRSLAKGRGLFLLRVTGESMIGAHILDGDYALIRPQKNAENGEIVAVRIGDTATLKRFYRTGKTVRLQPENPAMEPILLQGDGENEDAVIVGKVLTIIRSIGK
jgi:repressor LexA